MDVNYSVLTMTRVNCIPNISVREIKFIGASMSEPHTSLFNCDFS